MGSDGTGSGVGAGAKLTAHEPPSQCPAPCVEAAPLPLQQGIWQPCADETTSEGTEAATSRHASSAASRDLTTEIGALGVVRGRRNSLLRGLARTVLTVRRF